MDRDAEVVEETPLSYAFIPRPQGEWGCVASAVHASIWTLAVRLGVVPKTQLQEALESALRTKQNHGTTLEAAADALATLKPTLAALGVLLKARGPESFHEGKSLRELAEQLQSNAACVVALAAPGHAIALLRGDPCVFEPGIGNFVELGPAYEHRWVQRGRQVLLLTVT